MSTQDQRESTRPAPSRSNVVRDSFTMPVDDHRLIRELQLTYARAGILFNKGEVLRAGLHALNRMSPDELTEVAGRIEQLKAGRSK